MELIVCFSLSFLSLVKRLKLKSIELDPAFHLVLANETMLLTNGHLYSDFIRAYETTISLECDL